jgi:hypothetical protein
MNGESVMSKMRSDSTWNQLTPEQRETLETWLFEENLGYSETVERPRREFGLKATASGAGRFRRRRAAGRQAEDLAEAQAAAFDLNSKTRPLPNQGPRPTPPPVETPLSPPKFA